MTSKDLYSPNPQLHLCGVYEIVSLKDNKRYIGSTFQSFKKRLRRHFKELSSNSHLNPYLQAAWNKHGDENFVFVVVFICSKDEVRQKEQDYINSYDFSTLYNMCKQVDKPSSKPITEETRKRMSISRKNRKVQFYHSQETKQIISNKARERSKTRINPMLGKNHTDESKSLMSKNKKANYVKENHPFYGKTGKDSSNHKEIVDIITNQVFHSIKEAAEFYGYNKITLAQWLSGKYFNKSNLRYK